MSTSGNVIEIKHVTNTAVYKNRPGSRRFGPKSEAPYFPGLPPKSLHIRIEGMSLPYQCAGSDGDPQRVENAASDHFQQVVLATQKMAASQRAVPTRWSHSAPDVCSTDTPARLGKMLSALGHFEFPAPECILQNGILFHSLERQYRRGT